MPTFDRNARSVVVAAVVLPAVDPGDQADQTRHRGEDLEKLLAVGTDDQDEAVRHLALVSSCCEALDADRVDGGMAQI